MRILGIDPGTACGWAIRQHDGIINSGVWNLKPSRFEGPGMKAIKLRSLLCQVLSCVDLVAYEEVRRHLGVDAAHCYGGLVMTIQSVCEEAKVPYTAIPVGQIKRRATGSGTADKTKMIAAANAFIPGGGITDDNQADAIWIAVLAGETYETSRNPERNQGVLSRAGGDAKLP